MFGSGSGLLVPCAVALTACATSTDLGLLQRGIGDGTGGSLAGHFGIGAVPDKILAASFDVRGDLATSGDRFAIGGSVLGGLPVHAFKLLARAGVWHAVASTSVERSIVPTFELAGYVPLNDHPTDPKHPEWGTSTAGVVIGVREDLDLTAYTTVFVGLALFLVPGY